jgi:hypothetical protein
MHLHLKICIKVCNSTCLLLNQPHHNGEQLHLREWRLHRPLVLLGQCHLLLLRAVHPLHHLHHLMKISPLYQMMVLNVKRSASDRDGEAKKRKQHY